MWVPVPVELPKESNKQQEVQFKGEKCAGWEVVKKVANAGSLP